MFGQRSLELTLVLGCLAAGCVTNTRQQLSAGPTGCAPEHIVISEEERLAWVATCNGQRFRCSAGPTAVCSPEQPGNAPSPPSPAPPSKPDRPIQSPEEGITP
jgi:hypothetical protein